MRLCFAITVFDGLEMLERCVEHHLPVVDELIICYQKVSNTGIQDYDIQKKLNKAYGHINKISIIEYMTQIGANPKENERMKHQVMIDQAKRLACTHFIMGAVDHFYHHGDIARALQEFGNFDVTFTKMFTYYKDPTWQLDPIEEYYMPFIHKLYFNTEIKRGTEYPVLVDPSVRVTTCRKYAILPFMLHHYSMVRKDIRAKFESAASSWPKSKIKQFVDEFESYDIQTNPGVSYFQGRRIKIVPNYFNL